MVKNRKYWLFALVLGGTLVTALAPAQQLASAPQASLGRTSSSPSLIGKPALRWVIPSHYWMNTPRSVWLGGLQGHVTVIEFFRIGCPHCRDAAPSRRALYLKYQKQGLKVVGFQSPTPSDDPQDPENNWSQVQRTVRQWQLTYPIAFDKNSVLFSKYKLNLYPTVIVLDRQGVVRFQQTGYTPEKARQLDEFIAKTLQADAQ